MKMTATIILSLSLMSCNPKTENKTAEQDSLKTVFALPKKLKEVSGIAFSKDKNTLWGIEDAGNKNSIYGIDLQGNLVANVPVENTENIDWEDLIADKNGNLYVGDFGNNDNSRQNLAIYKVDLENVKQISTKVVQTTKFHYEGQTEFPPKKSNLLYDCEAFVELNGNFYLFTKNRSKGFDGTFLVYKIPNKEGDFEAKLVGKLKLDGNYDNAAITSASINEKGDQIALLTHKNVHLLTNFTENDFNNSKIQKIPFNSNTQKEGLVYKNDKTFWIADEKGKNKYGGNVYEFEIK